MALFSFVVAVVLLKSLECNYENLQKYPLNVVTQFWSSCNFVARRTLPDHLPPLFCEEYYVSWASLVELGFPCWAGLRWWRICLRCGRPVFYPWVGKIPWRRERLPTPVFWPGKFHGQRHLAGYSPWGSKESDTTERFSHLLFYWCNLKITEAVLIAKSYI